MNAVLSVPALPEAASKRSSAYWIALGFILTVYVSLEVAIPAGPVNVRPSGVWAGLLFGVWTLHAARRGSIRVPYAGAFVVLALVYAASTLWHHGTFFFQRGAVNIFLLALNVAHYVLLVDALLWTSPRVRDRAVDWLVLFGGVFCVYRAAAVVSTVLGLPIPFLTRTVSANFAEIVRNVLAGRPTGTGFQTVDSGLIAGVAVMLFARIALRRKANLREIAGALVMTFVIVTSLVRGAWIGTAFGVLILLSLLMVAQGLRPAAILKTFVGFVVAVAAVFGAFFLLFYAAVPGFTLTLIQRFRWILRLNAGTGENRTLLWRQMWEDFQLEPIWGRGGGAYQKFVTYPEQVTENFPLEMLHSAGILAILCLLIPFTATAIHAYRIVAKAGRTEASLRVIMTTAGFAAIFLAGLTNPGGWSGFYWVVVAVWIATVSSARSILRPAPVDHIRSGARTPNS